MRIGIALGLAVALATSLQAGTTYRMETTTQGLRARTFSGVAKVEAGRSRFEVTRNDGKILPAGSVILSSTGGRVITVIDPSRKVYYLVDVDAIAKALATTQQQLAPLMKIPEPVVSVRREGDGGLVQGFPTQRWLLRVTMGLSASANGAADRGMEITAHVWTTDRIPSEAGDALQIGRIPGGQSLFDAFSGARGKLSGFPLKSETTTRATMSGSTTTQTSRMLVSGVRPATFPPSTFAIPAGFRKIESPIDALIAAGGFR